MNYLLILHCKIRCTKGPEYCTVRTLPVLSEYCTVRTLPVLSEYCTVHTLPVLSEYCTVRTLPVLSEYCTVRTLPVLSEYCTVRTLPVLSEYWDWFCVHSELWFQESLAQNASCGDDMFTYIREKAGFRFLCYLKQNKLGFYNFTMQFSRIIRSKTGLCAS
jgi:hypothetical protein